MIKFQYGSVTMEFDTPDTFLDFAMDEIEVLIARGVKQRQLIDSLHNEISEDRQRLAWLRQKFDEVIRDVRGDKLLHKRD